MEQSNIQSTPASYFDDKYNQNSDPWGFKTSDYEAQKYAATVAALPRPRYRSAFEIGCSIGVLSSKLAQKCDSLLSVDIIEAPLEQAREHCRDLPQVRFERLQVPDEYPDEMFDLTVLSEVAYYWSMPDLKRAYRLIVDHLEPGGQVILVHWTPLVPEHPLTGDQVHEFFLEQAREGQGLRHLTGRREPRYRLDLFERD